MSFNREIDILLEGLSNGIVRGFPLHQGKIKSQGLEIGVQVVQVEES